MPKTQPVPYQNEGGAQYNMIARIERAPGIRKKDLDPEDAGVEASTHLIAMQLDHDVAATIPEGQLTLILETAASRILNESFAIHDCGQFEIDYQHASVEEIAAVNPSHCHEDTVGDQDFEDAGVTPLEASASLDDDQDDAPGGL